MVDPNHYRQTSNDYNMASVDWAKTAASFGIWRPLEVRRLTVSATFILLMNPLGAKLSEI